MSDSCGGIDERIVKRIRSYKQIIPSEDLTPEQYQTFLSVATPAELEDDIITAATLKLIYKQAS